MRSKKVALITGASSGIDVVIVEPGGIKTPRGLIAADKLKKTSGKGAM